MSAGVVRFPRRPRLSRLQELGGRLVRELDARAEGRAMPAPGRVIGFTIPREPAKPAGGRDRHE